MDEIDEQIYREHLDRLRRGGPARWDTGRNCLGMTPHVILNWMIEAGDAERFVAADGREWVRAVVVQLYGEQG